MLGGLFYSDHYIHHEPVWLDAVFLGKKPVVYLAFFQTAKLVYLDALEDIALEASEKLLPRDSWRKKTVKLPNGNYQYASGYSVPHEEFGGLSRMEWEDREIKRLADERRVSVHEGVRLIRDYPRNVGLEVTLDVPHFTIDNINEFIVGFLADGKGWRSEAPLSWNSKEMLPPGAYANAIVAPWEYGNQEKANAAP